jgi:hypothetical protein
MAPAILAAVCLSACAVFSPLPDLRTASDRAREVEPRCEGFGEKDAANVLSPQAVDFVEASYSHTPAGPVDRQARLRGARLHVRPMPGLTGEALLRSLECHQAAVTLGKASAVADDPYVLPGSWLDLDVDSERGGFLVLVRSDSFEEARAVLDRARRFAAPRPPAAVPTRP